MDRVLEVIAVLLSLLYTLMYLIGIMPVAFYPAAIGAAIFTYLCYKKEIYAEAFLQFFYIVMALLGFYFFYYGYPLGTWGAWQNLALVIGSTIATCFLGLYLKKKTSSKLPMVDSFTTVFSLGATWLMIMNIPDNWYYWVAVNAVSTVLYYRRGLKFGAALFGIYLMMSIDGCFESINWFEDLAKLFIL